MITKNMLWSVLGVLVLMVVVFMLLTLLRVLQFWLFPKSFPLLQRSCLYYGRVKHTRLKGGAVHHLDYPIFFSYLDLQEMQHVGWSLWPIFAVNKPWITFCSFDTIHHLKDYKDGKHGSLYDAVLQFMSEKSLGKLTTSSFSHVQILTHLTYFGYCFNPISIYFLKSTEDDCTKAVIAEVSNTPWIEMHSYALHDTIPNVEYDYHTEEQKVVAKWMKAFHVSPFMEMDYRYAFTFHEPTEKCRVTSQLIKVLTNETWFTASFDMQKLPITPINLLWVLVFYPLHTRIIQVWIHIEAVKIFLKGVPTFEHPNGTDVDFGFGITGERLKLSFWWLTWPFYRLASAVLALFGHSNNSSSKTDKVKNSE